MIEAKDLLKQFGEKIAVDIPSFVINDGDVLGLVGNNGAGKTTFFRQLLFTFLDFLLFVRQTSDMPIFS